MNDDKPNQPREFKFPPRHFGKEEAGRTFQPHWFDKYSWIHYDEDSDAAFSHVCINALKKNMISSNKAEDAVTKIGYTNWKKALEKNKGFAKHQASGCHKEATERLITAPTTAKGDIAYLIDENSQAIKQNNREMLLKILASIRYLARQSLPLRGNWKEEEKSEYDSNFFQLLKLRCEGDPKLAEWMDKKSNKFLSPKIQNYGSSDFTRHSQEYSIS